LSSAQFGPCPGLFSAFLCPFYASIAELRLRWAQHFLISQQDFDSYHKFTPGNILFYLKKSYFGIP
jgi:hypothetical protein